MGKEIVRRESPQILEKRSRLWHYKDAHEILTENKGSNKIRGIMLYSPKPVTVRLHNKAFQRIENLKFLIIYNINICEALKYLTNGLRFLQWGNYPFPLPSKYCPQKLVALEMQSSHIKLEKLFKQDFQCENLKHINLESCEFIKKLPELCTPNLEILDLFGCVNLVEIHESIGFLDKLKTWNLSYCERLKILPSNLMLKSLNSFDLVRCSRLEKFPNIHPEMKCLRDLDLQESGIRELPSSIGYLGGLTKLCLRDCPNLRGLPDTIYKLQQLQDLSIPTTHFLMQPDYFPALKSISLSRTNIIPIPESIGRFPRLGLLSIQNCKQLREILGLPKSIKCVDATDCFKLDLQSLLSQVGVIMGILPNTSCEGAGTNLLINTQLSDDFASKTESEDRISCFIKAPGAEIPKWCNHQSVGNYISFWVGRKFPKIALCIALGQNEQHQHVTVYFYINGGGNYVYTSR
nr:disease resistance protein RPS6-like [Quercus suber]